MNKQQINPFNQFLEDRLSSIRDTYQVSIDYTYDQDASAFLVRINNPKLWEEEEFQDSLTDINYDSIDIPHSRPILFVSPTDRHANFVPTHSLSVKQTSMSLDKEVLISGDYNYNHPLLDFVMKKTPFHSIKCIVRDNSPSYSYNTEDDFVKSNSPAAAI